MDKKSLRQSCKLRLDALTDEQRHEYSRAICDTLLASVNWSSITYVSCYESQEKFREVDTAELIIALHRQHPHLRIDTPSPCVGAPQPIQRYDIIIVPVLGYDRANNRLGRGSGWYDRFLAAQPSARKYGLAFSVQQLDVVAVEPHDISLDAIFTETK